MKTMTKNSDPYIMEFSNVVSASDCNTIIETRKNDPTINMSYWMEGLENKQQESFLLGKKLDDLNRPCITQYLNKFKDLVDEKDIHLVNYVLNSHVENHFDSLHYDTPKFVNEGREGFRLFICLLYLNHESFEGGQVIFPVQKYVIEPEEGKVVIFPASFQFPHMVTSISGAKRYSIRFTYEVKSEAFDLN